MTVPARAKTITPLLNAATFEADRQAKKKRKLPAAGGAFGSGPFGGSGCFGGGGGFRGPT